MGGKAPSSPDYTQLAEKTFEHDKSMLNEQTQANRPNQNNPFGSVQWEQDSAGNWTQNTSLNPDQQRQLEYQQQMGGDLSGLGAGMFGEVQNQMSSPFDYGQFGEQQGLDFDPTQIRQKAEDAAYGRATSRLDPQFEQGSEALEVKLRNQGLSPGDAAYDSATQNFERSKTDAYDRASSSASAAGMGEANQMYGQQMGSANFANSMRQNKITEAMRQRYMPMQDMQKLMGSGVQGPQFGNFNQAGMISGPDYMNAGMMNSNADQAAYQQEMGGLMGLGNMGIAAYGAGMFCDRRLKRHINRIGEYLGYPLYAFEYIWGEFAVGVMSDEVNHEAVTRLPCGYDYVDYTRIEPCKA